MRIKVLRQLENASRALTVATTLVTAATTIAVTVKEVRDTIHKHRAVEQESPVDLEALRAQLDQTPKPQVSRAEIESIFRELLVEYATKQVTIESPPPAN
ncbi:MAG: hypothetical protein WBP12_02320 [Candidatus Saccharimonas sp.]